MILYSVVSLSSFFLSSQAAFGKILKDIHSVYDEKVILIGSVELTYYPFKACKEMDNFQNELGSYYEECGRQGRN